ncbi:hypothetical protein [Leisingera sp. ANG-Vp]|uniref:hypothetical protein n=1 Tax=Leisingera sp. ANG-Vp TaxID=1577896 RepID=UPI00057CF45A|nr:hypothetical protein [Leisingera sp. ANG-Vp]KIC21659.1 hypothetical protein RA20_03305 [Leisingera sp. ANG-Vp]
MQQVRGTLLKLIALPFVLGAFWVWLSIGEPGFDIYALLPIQPFEESEARVLEPAVGWAIIGALLATGLILWRAGSKFSGLRKAKFR